MLFASVIEETDCGNSLVDGLEFRLDLAPKANFQKSPLPYMLTPKTTDIAYIEKLLEENPPYFDLDLSMAPHFIQHYPKTKFIISHHDFEKVPLELNELFERMQRFAAFSYKIAATPKNTNEALSLLLFGKKHPRLSVICMGEAGQFARPLGPVVSNVIDYGYLGSVPAAPGQMSIQELIKTYRYHDLSPSSKIFGLIGDPVSHSVGHLVHNKIFELFGIDACYVKMRVLEDELEEFFALAKKLSIRGLSVTMPLKEKILPYLDKLDEDAAKIGAVNTILFEKDQLIGTNTDGIGALDAIEKRMKVAGKNLLILGSGGAARAISYEGAKRGASIWILSRRAASFGYSTGIPNKIDIAINCSPHPLPVALQPNTLVMDIVYRPKITPFLQNALQIGCPIITGDEMFINQAAMQSAFWLNLKPWNYTLGENFFSHLF